VALSLRGRPLTLTLPHGSGGAWRVIGDAGDPSFVGPAGARVDGDSVTLPPWGALVLESGSG
jgi:hypothetical protein